MPDKHCVVQTIQEMDALVLLSMSVLSSCQNEWGLRVCVMQTHSLTTLLLDCQLRTLHLTRFQTGDLYEEKASVANVEPMFQTFVKLTNGFIVSWF